MVEPLVIPFVVVVRDELADGAPQRALADQDHALEAGVLDGAHEALRVGVQGRRAGGASDGGDIGRGERVAPGRPEERVAVMEEDPDVSQASVLGIGGVPHELGDPRPVGLGADARDLNAAAGQVTQDQHGDAGQAAWRPDLDRAAGGGGEHVPVGRKKLPPGRALLAFGGGVETEATGDDATTALDLLTAVEGPLVRITADAAYDTVAVYETATARGATVVIPPARTANVSGHGPRSPARDRTITWVKQLGRRRWKKTSGYHRQSRVENTFFRYTSIIGDGLRARSPAGQGSEVVLGCEILNRMTELGRPVSYRIGR